MSSSTAQVALLKLGVSDLYIISIGAVEPTVAALADRKRDLTRQTTVNTLRSETNPC